MSIPEPRTLNPEPERLGYIRALDGSPLYAAYHPAAEQPANAQNRFYPVVIAPPLFEERKSAYAALHRLACKLAAVGHAVLRFDYRGSGESGGNSATGRWKDLAEDTATARKTLARLAGKRDSVLLGLRLGATVALQETARVGGEAVIAIAPIVSGTNQVRLWKMRSKIRAELTASAPSAEPPRLHSPLSPPGRGAGGEGSNGLLDFDGYDVSQAFFDDVAAIDLPRDLGPLSCPGLIMQLGHKTDATAETTQLMKTLGSRARLEVLRMEPFWDKLDDVNTAPLEELVLKALAGF